MRKLFWLTFFLTISQLLLAQPPAGFDPSAMKNAREAVIKGRIIEANTNIPVEFASVAIFNLRDSSLVTGTITASDGSFTIKELPYGRFYLEAIFMGYEKTISEGLMLTPKKPSLTITDLIMKPSFHELDEVEIIADQAHVEYKLDRKVINVGQDINASTGTAVDILENTPSVNVDIDGNVSLRGSDNFTVLIDGKPTPLSGSDALQQIPASAIRNIEIITNPSAKFDPDGMAGIINIISKKSALDGISGIANATVGSRDKYSGDFLLNYRSEKINIYGGATYRDQTYGGSLLLQKQFVNPMDNTISYDETFGDRDRNRINKEVKGGIDYSFNDENILSLSANIGMHESGSGGKQYRRLYDESLTIDNYLLSDSYRTHGGDYYKLNLTYTHKFNDAGHELVAFIDYSSDNGDDSDQQSEFSSDASYNQLGIDPDKYRSREFGKEHQLRAQIDYTKPIGENGKFETGYQMRLDDELEDYVFEDYLNEEEIWAVNDSFSRSNDFYRNIQAAYATYGNKFGNYQFLAGLRTEYTDRQIKYLESEDSKTINRLDFFPSFHMSRSFRNNHQVMASYSRRINRPRGWSLEPFLTYMNSTTLRQGNPELEPEYMNSFELSYQKSFGKSFIAFETYYKKTLNKIERVQTVYNVEEKISLMTFDNINQDHSLGAELMMNFSLKKWLNINASSNLYRYWIKGDINGLNIDTHSNNWNLRLNSTFNISPKTRLQLTGMYNGPSVTAQGEVDAFFFSNVALRQDFFDRKLSATLQVKDIFGTMKHKFTSYGTGFSFQGEFSREPHIVMLSLSYKINNYKQKRGNKGTGSDMDSGDSDMF